MAIKRIDLSWIVISDFNKSKNFFENTLGLELNEIHEQFGWAEFKGAQGGCLLGIAKNNEESSIKDEVQCKLKPGANAVVTFTVDNMDETLLELKKKGVSFIGDMIQIPNGPRMIYFSDPDGNLFQLTEDHAQ